MKDLYRSQGAAPDWAPEIYPAYPESAARRLRDSSDLAILIDWRPNETTEEKREPPVVNRLTPILRVDRSKSPLYETTLVPDAKIDCPVCLQVDPCFGNVFH